MVKFIFFIAITLIFTSCNSELNQGERKEVSSSPKDSNTKGKLQDTTLVKKWIESVILGYVNSENENEAIDELEKSLTPDYFKYKNEAITLEYSEMSVQEFQEKWKHKYDINHIGNGGFFTTNMDHGKIEIISCRFTKSIGNNTKFFSIIIKDKRWDKTYSLNLKVIQDADKLLIDDVKDIGSLDDN